MKASDKRSSFDFVSNFPPFMNAAAGMHLFANCLGSPTLNPIYLNLFFKKNIRQDMVREFVRDLERKRREREEHRKEEESGGGDRRDK